MTKAINRDWRDEWDRRHERFRKSFAGLSVRAFNCFYLHRERVDGSWSHDEYGIPLHETNESDKYDSLEKVISAIKSGELHPKSSSRPRNYGWKTHVEVCQFLGLNNGIKSGKFKRIKMLEEQVRELKRELGV